MRKRILLVLMIFVTAFIWGQSMKPGEASTATSSAVTVVLQEALDFLHIAIQLTDHIVRKMAHFSEHAVFGLLSGLYVYPDSIAADSRRKQLTGALTPIAAGFLVGFIDETIQIFSDRGSSVADVWLDLAGVVVGAAFAYLVTLIARRRRRKKHEKET